MFSGVWVTGAGCLGAPSALAKAQTPENIKIIKILRANIKSHQHLSRFIKILNAF